MTSYTIERTRSSIKKMLSADEDENAWKVLPDGQRGALPHRQDSAAATTVAAHTGEKIWP